MNSSNMDDIMNSSNSDEKFKRTRTELDDLRGQFGFKTKVGNKVKSTAVLGCNWNLESDVLSPNIPNYKYDVLTKRKVLSRIARIWDPLRICTGILISARLVFQSIVRLKMELDEPS